MPKLIFDYIDGGAFAGQTQAQNASPFDDWLLNARQMRGIAVRDLSTSILGQPSRLPIAIAPVGLAGAFHARGEVRGAAAARAAGIPFILSGFSVESVEEVMAALGSPPWLQLYLLSDRSIGEAMLDRASRLGIEVLVLTVDASIGSVRERDVRNGLTTANRLTATMLLDFLAHPRWLMGHVAARKRLRLQGLPANLRSGSLMSQIGRSVQLLDQAVCWEDMRWLRDRWSGKIVVKGVLNTADALRAIDEGADGVVVSNHGGRQLDGCVASIRALPAIAAAVNGKAAVLIDGGITRGSQVVKALALGADAALIGRAYAYGLGADGERGVTAVLTMIAKEFDVTMALMGVRSVAELRACAQELVVPAESR